MPQEFFTGCTCQSPLWQLIMAVDSIRFEICNVDCRSPSVERQLISASRRHQRLADQAETHWALSIRCPVCGAGTQFWAEVIVD